MLAAALRALFLWLADRRWLGRLALRIPFLRRMPLRFVAGTTLDDGAAAVRGLNASGATATIDVLGESVTDRAAADRAAAAYVATIERIAADRLDANVSLKLSQMGLGLGIETCLEVLRPIVVAGPAGTTSSCGSTWRAPRRPRRRSRSWIGCGGKGMRSARSSRPYLHRSPVTWSGWPPSACAVRICKGAYAEPEAIAWHDRMAIDGSFVDLVITLLEADAYPGVATHDPAMIEAVTRAASQRAIGPDRFEFQMLYGVRRDLQRQLVRDGYRVRVYVPYGTEWYPYFMRRLAERPGNVVFVLRSLVGERPDRGRSGTGRWGYHSTNDEHQAAEHVEPSSLHHLATLCADRGGSAPIPD